MSADAELLRQYASTRSEAAFAALVRQHLGLVYHTALRHLDGDAHAAEDVAQLVFTDLARKAASLARRDSLAGWLHHSARYAALHRRRGDRRRHTREERAHAMHELDRPDTTATDWSRLRGVIDEALLKLRPRDREAVLLHYFEGLDCHAVGDRLGLSAQGARSLLERALGKLQPALARLGVTSTMTALTAILALHAASAPPSALAATVTSGAAAAAASTPAPFWLGLLTGKKAAILVGSGLFLLGAVTYVRSGSTLTGLIAQSIRQQEGRPRFIGLMEGIGAGVEDYYRGTKSGPKLASGSSFTMLFRDEGMVGPGPAVALDLNLTEIGALNRLQAEASARITAELLASVTAVRSGQNSLSIECDLNGAEIVKILDDLTSAIRSRLDASSAAKFNAWPRDWIMYLKTLPPTSNLRGPVARGGVSARGLLQIDLLWTGTGTDAQYDMQVSYPGGGGGGFRGESARGLYNYWFFDLLKKHHPAIVTQVGHGIQVAP